MRSPLSRSRRGLLAAPLALFATVVLAQGKQPQPQPTPMPPAIPAPVDKPYVGPIELNVDLSDNVRRVIHVNESVPVSKGMKELTLLYPEWIPGNHSPTGPISALGGIVTKVDGQRVQWVRDRVNVFAFHVPLTADAKTVTVEFDYLSPIKRAEGRIQISDAIADLAWNEVAMYPAGYFTRDIPFDATLKLPDGWKYATALETDSQSGSTVKFKETPFNTLVDSPLYAGTHFKRINLSPTATDKVFLDVFADEEKDLAVTDEELAAHKRLTLEADKLYGSHHYNHYDFLLLLSDKVGGIGLEHHQSSEDGHGPDYFTDWDGGVSGRDLLGHEYTHSWDGKFRRPADLWTPNFNVPMRDDLLWVYEGMTQYWGNILTARAGMRTAEQTRDIFARVAAGFEASHGRDWRPLVDTTNQPTVSQRRPVTWVSWQRPEDYYTEGMLIWLDADTKIRELTKGEKSLDDFCKKFFGVYNGSFVTYQYTLEDVVHDLNAVAPYDWMKFLQEHVYDLHPQVPEDGFTRGGYKLIYNDTPTAWIAKAASASGYGDFSTSLGLSIGSARGANAGNGGSIGNVWWGSPAFQAGITPDMTLVSVNGEAYTAKLLTEAVLKAEKDKQPIQLQFFKDGKYMVVPMAYYDGMRYPHLERVEGTPARMDDIMQPSKSPLPAM